MTARNKCIECKFKWRDHPGGYAIKTINYKLVCPRCGSAYFKWSSYKFDKKKYSSELDFGKY